MTERKRIGIFGCSADPFTLAHREIVKEALEQNLVDAVIIAPTIVDYHRGDKLPWLSTTEKLCIIRALTEDLDRVYIDSTELNRKDLIQLSPELQEHAVKSWRFIDTLLRIKLEYLNTPGPKNKDFYPIIGGDSLDNFKTWFAWKDILKQSAGLIAVDSGIDRHHRNLEGSDIAHEVCQQIVPVLAEDLDRPVVRGVRRIRPFRRNPALRIL